MGRDDAEFSDVLSRRQVVLCHFIKFDQKCHRAFRDWAGPAVFIIEKLAEDPFLSREGMNAIPTAFEP